MELVETLLSAVLLGLAATMATIAFLAQRSYRDARFLSVGLALVLLAVVGGSALFAALCPTAEPNLDVGLVPLLLLVLMVVLLILPLLLRFPASRAPDDR